MEYPKKLIEVALPLDDINREAAKEKSIRHGHPSTLHLWWARRPLAAARAVLFAQLVNDPGGERGYGAHKGQTRKAAEKEREKLFDIIRELVKWENLNNQEILDKACKEIRKSWEETCKISGEDPTKLPAFHDPFAGGGTIPLEAQRLGLEVYASDLNPVAVLINKGMIEVPPKFSGRAPINPEARQSTGYTGTWFGAQGLAEDIRYYGKFICEEAEKRIGQLYPKIEIINSMANDRQDLKPYIGKKLRIIAWIWARTVKSPNPAFSEIDVPLISTFVLGKIKGQDVITRPIIEGSNYKFAIEIGKFKDINQLKTGTKVGRGGNFRCLISDAPIPVSYIREQGKLGLMGHKLIGIIAEGDKERCYLPPNSEIEKIAFNATPDWIPQTKINYNPRDIRTQLYGLTKYGDLHTKRQLVALNTFSDLIKELPQRIIADAIEQGLKNDNIRLRDNGTGAAAYADAIAVYVSFAIDRCANYWSSLTPWGGSFIVQTFGRQALPMVWDYAEANPFSNSTGNWMGAIDWISRCIAQSIPAQGSGFAVQANAANQKISKDKIISTDPPYYDNIGYADLSDYFYVWMRRNLKEIYPSVFSTLSVPKQEEIVSAPHRHGGKEKGEEFFLNKITDAMKCIMDNATEYFPITIYYAFKQSETNEMGTSSSGWETFLKGVIDSGLTIVGTWPMRTERDQGLKTGSNVLASSIILVCRKRSRVSKAISRKDFLRELNLVLPEAINDMIGGKDGSSPIAPVDLAQAAIGPGIAVFSKYSSVLEASGDAMTVKTALIIINKSIDEYFTKAEGIMDVDTKFCVDWFQQFGFNSGPFGEGDVLARAKGTSVDGVKIAGVIESSGGKVRLLKMNEYPSQWDPNKDNRVPVWEACHHICKILEISELRAGELLAKMPEKAESIRQLAYRLYTLCERKGWTDESGIYNNLIISWHAILDESHKVGHRDQQITMEI